MRVVVSDIVEKTVDLVSDRGSFWEANGTLICAGLPMSHITYVEHIVVGMPIFLFNYTERKMHGIFEAVSDGALNISHYAWTGGTDGARTSYPAQVCPYKNSIEENQLGHLSRQSVDLG